MGRKDICNLEIYFNRKVGEGRMCMCEIEKERGREFCRGNETTTDRDPYVITGHRVKNPQHKITKKILSFHFSTFCIYTKKENENGGWRRACPLISLINFVLILY